MATEVVERSSARPTVKAAAHNATGGKSMRAVPVLQRKEGGKKNDEQSADQSSFMPAENGKAGPVTTTPVRSGAIQKKANNTGMPDNLKSGIEQMGGFDMSDVKVHYNSARPAQLQALAYAQGTDIHIGSGQERHLPHEAWHVVQQKQGRVKATTQLKQGVAVNDDTGLEQEADVMGAKLAHTATSDRALVDSPKTKNTATQLQVIQRVERGSGWGSLFSLGGISADSLRLWTAFKTLVEVDLQTAVAKLKALLLQVESPVARDRVSPGVTELGVFYNNIEREAITWAQYGIYNAQIPGKIAEATVLETAITGILAKEEGIRETKRQAELKKLAKENRKKEREAADQESSRLFQEAEKRKKARADALALEATTAREAEDALKNAQKREREAEKERERNSPEGLARAERQRKEAEIEAFCEEYRTSGKLLHGTILEIKRGIPELTIETVTQRLTEAHEAQSTVTRENWLLHLGIAGKNTDGPDACHYTVFNDAVSKFATLSTSLDEADILSALFEVDPAVGRIHATVVSGKNMTRNHKYWGGTYVGRASVALDKEYTRMVDAMTAKVSEAKREHGRIGTNAV